MCTSTTLPLVTSLTRAAAQWFTLNQDVSTTPLAHPFSRTTHSLTCPALLTSLPRSTALICCSLALSLTPELVGKRMIRCLKTTWFCPTVRGSFTNSQDPLAQHHVNTNHFKNFFSFSSTDIHEFHRCAVFLFAVFLSNFCVFLLQIDVTEKET